MMPACLPQRASCVDNGVSSSQHGAEAAQAAALAAPSTAVQEPCETPVSSIYYSRLPGLLQGGSCKRNRSWRQPNRAQYTRRLDHVGPDPLLTQRAAAAAAAAQITYNLAGPQDLTGEPYTPGEVAWADGLQTAMRQELSTLPGAGAARGPVAPSEPGK